MGKLNLQTRGMEAWMRALCKWCHKEFLNPSQWFQSLVEGETLAASTSISVNINIRAPTTTEESKKSCDRKFWQNWTDVEVIRMFFWASGSFWSFKCYSFYFIFHLQLNQSVTKVICCRCCPNGELVTPDWPVVCPLGFWCCQLVN